MSVEIGVGEGWQFVGYAHGSVAYAYRPEPHVTYRNDQIEDMRRAGYDVVVNPYGRVFTRAQADGVFKPRDPAIAPPPKPKRKARS